MTQAVAIEYPTAPDAKDGGAQAESCLNITVLYRDGPSHEWAMEKCRRAAQLVGPSHLHTTWWQLGFLAHPKVAEEALQHAVLADIIIVALHATEEMPTALVRWFETLLSRRPQGEGALVALVGMPAAPEPRHLAWLDYLRQVASRAGLDFLPQEFPAPLAPPEDFMEEMTQRASAMSHLLSDILDHGRHLPPPPLGRTQAN